jgi:hypothetical protein
VEVTSKTPEEIQALGVAIANGEVFCGLQLLLMGYDPMKGALLLNQVFLALTFLNPEDQAQLKANHYVPYQYISQAVGTVSGNLPGFIDNEWLTYLDTCKALDIANSLTLHQ